MLTSAPQDSIYGTVSEWKPDILEQWPTSLMMSINKLTEFVNCMTQMGIHQNNKIPCYGYLWQCPRLDASGQISTIKNGSILDGVYSTVVDGLGPVMQNIPQFTSDGAYYGDMSTAGAYNSYASRSLTLAQN